MQDRAATIKAMDGIAASLRELIIAITPISPFSANVLNPKPIARSIQGRVA